jgi:hypothetical protein
MPEVVAAAEALAPSDLATLAPFAAHAVERAEACIASARRRRTTPAVTGRASKSPMTPDNQIHAVARPRARTAQRRWAPSS